MAEAPRIMKRTVEIVEAYVAQHHLEPLELHTLISEVHASLNSLGKPAPTVAPLVPAVPIRKSVTRDAIICLEDGKSFKSLKRHLSSRYDMTPEQYRAKWGLPSDYPMVAAAYSETRSALAKSTGLGRMPASIKPDITADAASDMPTADPS